MSAASQPVGIDLGTWKICAASLDATGHSEMIRDERGDTFLPNAVRFTETDIIVGREARNVMFLYRDEVAYWMKRELGTALYSRPIRGQKLPPEVIQACVLRRLRDVLHRQIPSDSRCIFSVPGHFDHWRCQAVMDAGEIAGLSGLGVVQDHVAAVLAFLEATGESIDRASSRQRLFFVFDLGGGACQMATLVLHEGVCRTLSYEVNPQLSGYDFDLRLGELVAERMLAEGFSDPRGNPLLWNRIYGAVVEAKHNLSARDRTRLEVELESARFEMVISRQEFESQCTDLIASLRRKLTRHLQRVSSEPGGSIVPVVTGGGVRMPMIQQVLGEVFGQNIHFTVNPEEAVARGAALYGALYLERSCSLSKCSARVSPAQNNFAQLNIESVLPFTLFLAPDWDPEGKKIIVAGEGTALPSHSVHELTIPQPVGGAISLVLWKEMASRREKMGQLLIRETSQPAGPSVIELEVTCTKTGELGWTARWSGSTQKLEVVFIPASGLERETITRWRETLGSAKSWGHVSEGLARTRIAADQGPEESESPPYLPAREEAGAPAADSRPMATPPSRPRHPRLAAAQAQGRWMPLEIAPPAVTPKQYAPPEPTTVQNVTAELPLQEKTESTAEIAPAPVFGTGPLIRRDVVRVTREELLREESLSVPDSIKPAAVFEERRRELSASGGAEADVPHEQFIVEPELSPSRSAGTRSRRVGDRVRVGFGITLPRAFIGIVGFVVSGLLGLAIGYWLVSKLFPESWILRPW
ncbi:Hsp70 family protein [Thermogutta sp.]|uniref:Hsp70 family protein n=1 Tax=Thermogutta sp. TaxID=1962930 RepID=UPI0032201D1A